MPQPTVQTVHIQSAIITCNFNRFTARLTRSHLIIHQKAATKSFPLADIKSVTIFNNAPQHQQQVNSCIRRRKQLNWFMLTPAIALVINYLPLPFQAQLYAWAATPFLALLICAFLPASANGLEMQCGLIIETATDTVNFPFTNNGLSAADTGRFLQQLKDWKAAGEK